MCNQHINQIICGSIITSTHKVADSDKFSLPPDWWSGNFDLGCEFPSHTPKIYRDLGIPAPFFFSHL